MSIPRIAPIPPAEIRLGLAPEEWTACMDAWLTVGNIFLRLPAKLSQGQMNNGGSLQQFLASFYRETTQLQVEDHTLDLHQAFDIQKVCFKLVNRMAIDGPQTSILSDFDFVSNFCRVHLKTPALPLLLSRIWRRPDLRLETTLQKKKISLTKLLESSSTGPIYHELVQIAPILRASSDASSLFMTGSDFLDGLTVYFDSEQTTQGRKAARVVAYLGFDGLIRGEVPQTSLLTDHLYALKSHADLHKDRLSLLVDLVTNTPLLGRLRRHANVATADRLIKLLNILETYHSQTHAQRRSSTPRRKGKGKSTAAQYDENPHFHSIALVSRIQDLFPDLGSGFVLKLLDEYNDDVEQATAHILEDSLPPHLNSLDRSEQAPMQPSATSDGISSPVPRSTPPPPASFVPVRKNVFDDDEFDRLQFDTSRLHIGKKDKVVEPAQSDKAAILSALAAFDSDDDERDDTYDAEDVGGTVDNAHPDGEPDLSAKAAQEERDTILFTTFKSSPQLFGRTFDTRRDQARQALKAETGMTDEALEGWAIMLQRDPKRLQRLEIQHSAFDGQQTNLGRTFYRGSPAGTDTEDTETPRELLRGRGRGRGRGQGRGGHFAGPSGDSQTANAQRRKEASKGSRANHNRRDRRAKKMARGGFAA